MLQLTLNILVFLVVADRPGLKLISKIYSDWMITVSEQTDIKL